MNITTQSLIAQAGEGSGSTMILAMVTVLMSLFGLGFMFLVLTQLYKRPPKSVAFVRNGAGGEKLIMNGGAIVVPIFQIVTPVDLTTHHTPVACDDAGFTTKDGERVRLKVDCHVRVKPEREAISNAARSMGERCSEPFGIPRFAETKIVAALRNAVVEMDRSAISGPPATVAPALEAAVNGTLEPNGLELETFSLISVEVG